MPEPTPELHTESTGYTAGPLPESANQFEVIVPWWDIMEVRPVGEGELIEPYGEPFFDQTNDLHVPLRVTRDSP